ncbi:hypothetical protein Y032_0342g3025 [Ancylostoma ceylanicum]|uniref:Uncharacterized protein n=1 Tax=Ancylostoma ceylanicum TaxID=53326 RepID=A0A016RXV9_9BILA|nr:hypothetical protein Y032_0342g3025 [Ancylostoma ceylanicum]
MWPPSSPRTPTTTTFKQKLTSSRIYEMPRSKNLSFTVPFTSSHAQNVATGETGRHRGKDWTNTEEHLCTHNCITRIVSPSTEVRCTRGNLVPDLQVEVLHRHIRKPLERKILEANEIKRCESELNTRKELVEALRFTA